MTAWGLTAPESLGGEWVHMADLNLLTDLTTSEFADLRMFFQHERFQNDMNLYSDEWSRAGRREIGLWEDVQDEDWGTTVPTGTNGWPEDHEEAEERFVEQIASYGCPFAWLLGDN